MHPHLERTRYEVTDWNMLGVGLTAEAPEMTAPHEAVWRERAVDASMWDLELKT